MLNALAALLLLAASGYRSYEDRGPPIVLKDAVVVSAIEAPADSGTIAFWNRIDVKTADGKAMSLFEVHLSKGEPPVPAVGSICDFTYRMGQLGGSMGPGLDIDQDWAMVETSSCRPG